MIYRLFASCTYIAYVIYYQTFHLIWVIQRSVLQPDTAWGYTTDGMLDTTVIAATIPTGDLVNGHWINSDADTYVRHLYSTPFDGGTTTTAGDIPAELTRYPNGYAGIAPAHVTDFGEWSVNLFDSLGNWITRYPIRGSDGSSAFFAQLLSADSVIIYEAVFTSGYEIRALKP